MSTHERRIRIAWVETDAPAPPVVVEEAPPVVEVAPVVVSEADRQATEAARAQVWSMSLWLGACGVFAGVEGWVLPAFTKMFKEVGVSLPPITEAVLGTPGLIYGLGVLTLLHAATLARRAETRRQLRILAFIGVVLGIGLTLYGLFVPMTTLISPL